MKQTFGLEVAVARACARAGRDLGMTDDEIANHIKDGSITTELGSNHRFY